MAQSARPEDLRGPASLLSAPPRPSNNKSQVRRMFIASGRRTCCPELLDHPAGLRAPVPKAVGRPGPPFQKEVGRTIFSYESS